MPLIQLIAFDADDTLWHNETLYQDTKHKVIELMAEYASPAEIGSRLDEIETSNLRHYGYGAKSFILSIVETAVEVSSYQVKAVEIEQILQLGKALITAEMQLLEGVEETIAVLSEAYPLMIITKGDLLDQEAKLARSGLANYFRYFETVSEKNVENYRKILERYKVPASQFVMVGNALKSDILPVIQLGGYAVYIPYALTWAHEMNVDTEVAGERYFTIERMTELPKLIANLAAGQFNREYDEQSE